MNLFWILGGKGRMAVRWKGFSCHLLSHIRGRGSIYGVSVLPELHVHWPIPFFPLDLFLELLFLTHPLFLPSATPCPLALPQMSSPVPAACIVSCTQIAFPQINFKEPLMEVDFRKTPTVHFSVSARAGFKCSRSSQEAYSRSGAGQMLQRPAHQRSVCPGLSDHVCLSVLGKITVIHRWCACVDFEIIT